MKFNKIAGKRLFKGLGALVAGLSLVCVSMSSSASSLVDAIHQTLLTNPDILSSKATEGAYAADIRQAQGLLYPSVDVSAGIGREYSNNPATRGSNTVLSGGSTTGGGATVLTRREGQVLIRQLVFDGGDIRGRIKQRTFDYDAATFRVVETQEKLAFDATRAYLEIMRQREILVIRKKNIIAHEDMVSKVQKRLEAGAGIKSEISLAKSRLALAISDKDATIGLLQNAYDTYIQVVGVPAGKVLLDPGTPNNLPHSLEQAQALAMEINPSIAVSAAQNQAAGAAIGIAKAAFYPRFTVDLTASYNNNLDGVAGRNDERQAMLRMTYNIFKGGSDRAAVRAAVDRQVAAMDDVDTARRKVLEDVALTWNDLQAGKNRLPYLRQHRDESLITFDAYVKQFQLGQRTLFDLLNAQSEHYDASVNYINGKYDIKTNSYRLLASIGNLVSTMAQRMDPIQADEPSYHHPKHRNKSSTMNKNVGTPPQGDNTAPAANNGFYTENAEGFQKAVTLAEEENKARPQQLLEDEIVVSEAKQTVVKPVAVTDPNRNHYTLQLMASKDKALLDKFIKDNHLQGKAKYYAANVNGQTWYRLIYGDYADKKGAWDAVSKMPKHLAKSDPMVRQYASIPSELVG